MAKIINFTADAEEQAEELVSDAWEAKTRGKKIALSKKALDISPGCIDAYNLLAICETGTPMELVYCQKAIEIYRKNKGEAFFRENAGDFWSIRETRPYMFILQGYGKCRWDMGDCETAIQTYQEMLVLNSGDNQGVRFCLMSWLLLNIIEQKGKKAAA